MHIQADSSKCGTAAVALSAGLAHPGPGIHETSTRPLTGTARNLAGGATILILNGGACCHQWPSWMSLISASASSLPYESQADAESSKEVLKRLEARVNHSGGVVADMAANERFCQLSSRLEQEMPHKRHGPQRVMR